MCPCKVHDKFHVWVGVGKMKIKNNNIGNFNKKIIELASALISDLCLGIQIFILRSDSKALGLLFSKPF